MAFLPFANTEVLTPDGWVSASKLTQDTVVCRSVHGAPYWEPMGTLRCGENMTKHTVITTNKGTVSLPSYNFACMVQSENNGNSGVPVSGLHKSMLLPSVVPSSLNPAFIDDYPSELTKIWFESKITPENAAEFYKGALLYIVLTHGSCRHDAWMLPFNSAADDSYPQRIMGILKKAVMYGVVDSVDISEHYGGATDSLMTVHSAWLTRTILSYLRENRLLSISAAKRSKLRFSLLPRAGVAMWGVLYAALFYCNSGFIVDVGRVYYDKIAVNKRSAAVSQFQNFYIFPMLSSLGFVMGHKTTPCISLFLQKATLDSVGLTNLAYANETGDMKDVWVTSNSVIVESVAKETKVIQQKGWLLSKPTQTRFLLVRINKVPLFIQE